MFDRRALIDAIILVGVIIVASPAYTQEKSIVVASTTSMEDSGLFEYLLPIFKQKTGITVKVLAQGTGQALDAARRGDADVVFVHAKSAEEQFLGQTSISVIHPEHLAHSLYDSMNKSFNLPKVGDRL
jgi:tungstate transport system substrate-binding protein